METAIQSVSVSVLAKPETKTKAATSPIWDYLEYNRFGFTGAILVVVLCLGGIAAAVALSKSLPMLMVVGFTSLIVEVMLIAIAPMKRVMIFAAIAVLVDLFVYIALA